MNKLNKSDLLKSLEESLKKGEIRDRSIITKVELASEEALNAIFGDLHKSDEPAAEPKTEDEAK